VDELEPTLFGERTAEIYDAATTSPPRSSNSVFARLSGLCRDRRAKTVKGADRYAA